MMLQLSVYLPTELEWLRCVRFVTRWLEKRENIQLHLNKRLWASASDAKKFNFEDKRRKKKKVRRKRGGIDFFCVYSFSQWSEHANKVWCQQLSIYIHNGLDNVVVAFEEISISHRIFFSFLFLFTFLQNSDHIHGNYVKILEYFHLTLKYFKIFGLFFSVYRYSFSTKRRHCENRCYANNLKQHSIRLIGENYQRQQQCDNSLFYVFRFLSHQHRKKKIKPNTKCKWSAREMTFFCLFFFILASYNKLLLLLETWSKLCIKPNLYKAEKSQRQKKCSYTSLKRNL